MPREVPATLQVYLDRVIEQMWLEHDAPSVVFLVQAESVNTAKKHLHGLPLGEAGLMGSYLTFCVRYMPAYQKLTLSF